MGRLDGSLQQAAELLTDEVRYGLCLSPLSGKASDEECFWMREVDCQKCRKSRRDRPWLRPTDESHIRTGRCREPNCVLMRRYRPVRKPKIVRPIPWCSRPNLIERPKRFRIAILSARSAPDATARSLKRVCGSEPLHRRLLERDATLRTPSTLCRSGVTFAFAFLIGVRLGELKWRR
jgi:hypothetical protein